MYGEICDTHRQTVLDTFRNTFENMNYILERVKEYNPKGRNQTEEEAREIDGGVRYMLDMENVPYKAVTGDYSGINNITSSILDRCGKEHIYRVGFKWGQ